MWLTEAPKFGRAPWTRDTLKLLQSPYFFPHAIKPNSHYPRTFCTLPSFARIKRPRWRSIELNDQHLQSHGKIGDFEQSSTYLVLKASTYRSGFTSDSINEHRCAHPRRTVTLALRWPLRSTLDKCRNQRQSWKYLITQLTRLVWTVSIYFRSLTK